LDGRLEGFGFKIGGHDTEFRRFRFMSPDQLCPAFFAELGVGRIVKATLGTLNNHGCPFAKMRKE
jgi:hypothetical protein